MIEDILLMRLKNGKSINANKSLIIFKNKKQENEYRKAFPHTKDYLITMERLQQFPNTLVGLKYKEYVFIEREEKWKNHKKY